MKNVMSEWLTWHVRMSVFCFVSYFIFISKSPDFFDHSITTDLLSPRSKIWLLCPPSKRKKPTISDTYTEQEKRSRDPETRDAELICSALSEAFHIIMGWHGGPSPLIRFLFDCGLLCSASVMYTVIMREQRGGQNKSYFITKKMQKLKFFSKRSGNKMKKQSSQSPLLLFASGEAPPSPAPGGVEGRWAGASH